MTGTPHPANHLTRLQLLTRLRTSRADEGLTLVEVMVSLVVLALFAVAISSALVTALGTTRTNKLRVQAADLAARQIAVTRNVDVLSVPDGQVYANSDGTTTTTPTTVTEDGTAFTITQTAEYVPSGNVGSTCSAAAGSSLGYKRVSVVVSWPNMGTTTPVRADTLMRLPVTGIGSAISVPVTDQSGSPISGVTVTALLGGVAQGSALTGDDGCAVIGNLSAGSYSVSAADTGYVDYSGNPAPSHTVASPVVSGSLTQDTAGFTLGAGSSMVLSLTTPSGYALPVTPLTVSVTNPSGTPAYPGESFTSCASATAYCYSGAGTSSLTLGSPSTSNTTLLGMFPYTTPYTAYVSDAGDSAATAVSLPVSVVGGTSPAVTAALGGVSVTNTGTAATVYAYGVNTTSAVVLQLSATGGLATNATAKYALPTGTWRLETANSTAATVPTGHTWPRVTITSSNPANNSPTGTVTVK